MPDKPVEKPVETQSEQQNDQTEQPPEGVNVDLWQKNRDLQQQMRDQLQRDEDDRISAAQAAAGQPQTTTTMPSQTVSEAGAANEAANKKK
jgi:5-hydroxyisourate hydrolase-like protein (transthyretin family)